MLPSASMGDPAGPGVFEPCHGSAPDIAGQDKANPLVREKSTVDHGHRAHMAWLAICPAPPIFTPSHVSWPVLVLGSIQGVKIAAHLMS